VKEQRTHTEEVSGGGGDDPSDGKSRYVLEKNYSVDLRPFIQVSDDEAGVVLDRACFDAAVPACLEGPPLGHGERLRLLAPEGDFSDIRGEPPAHVHDLYRIGYGMQVWVGNSMGRGAQSPEGTILAS
jgi:hypothetical protein